MWFVFLVVVVHVLWLYRRTRTLLLPSIIFLSLEFLLQVFLPYLLVEHIHTHPMLGRAVWVIGLGFCAIILGYHICLMSKVDIAFKRFYLATLSHRYGKLDFFLKRSLIVLVVSGSLIIASVFLLMGVVPLLSSTPGPARVFFDNPSYFSYYKHPYWIGISIVCVSIINEFIFYLSGGVSGRRTFLLIGLGALMLSLTAHRGPLFIVILGIYTFYYQAYPDRLTIRKLLLHTSVGVICLMGLLYLREGSGGLIMWVIGALSHGSTFVDFVELVDALERFGDSAYLMGKTYLGDLLGFLPYGVFDFRDQYRWKEWTKILFEAPPTAGGYRLTSFGESYFNFGFLGVAVQGFLAGFLYAIFDPLVVALGMIFKDKAKLSVSWYILLNVMLATVVSLVLWFYNILFFMANIFAVIGFFLISIYIRRLSLSR